MPRKDVSNLFILSALYRTHLQPPTHFHQYGRLSVGEDALQKQ